MVSKYSSFKKCGAQFRLIFLVFVSLIVFLGSASANGVSKDEEALFSAVRAGDLERVSLLVGGGADVNIADKYGEKPLCLAASNGYLEIAKLLLSHGADVNFFDPYGSTPLVWAAYLGHLDMVELFLRHGADANIASLHGFTPLYWALRKRSLEMLTLLLDHGVIMSVSVAEKCFEVMSVDALQSLLRRRDVQSAIGGFPQYYKRALLNSLSVREFALGGEMTALIELFEAQFGVRREDVNVATNEWRLSKVLIAQGVDAAKELIADKVCIGIVTVRGLSYDNIIKAAKRYELTHPEFAFYYVNQEVIDSLGVDGFSGLIFPGAGDNYPRNLSEFTLADMPEASRTETEIFYQYVYERAQSVGVPTLGICAGAQHLALHRGAALTRNKTNDRNVKMIPFRVPYFLSLNTEERKALLEYCDAPELLVDVFRAHSYSAVTESLQEQGFALGIEDGVTPLAFYEDLDVLGIQFHPEARYEGIRGNYGDGESRKRQTNLLNGFFELCASYQGWINWGRDWEICREDALMMRDGFLQGILDRLAECEENPDALDREGSWYEEELLFQAI